MGMGIYVGKWEIKTSSCSVDLYCIPPSWELILSCVACYTERIGRRRVRSLVMIIAAIRMDYQRLR